MAFSDYAIIRFNRKEDEGNEGNDEADDISESMIKVVRDDGLRSLINNNRANSNIWKSVNSIQSNVKAPIGCGTPIIVKFFAPIDPEDITSTINYDFRQFGDDEELIRNDEEKYCLKQAYKMCFYI